MFRTIASVITGFVVWTILWLTLNQSLMAAFPDAFDAAGLTSATAILLACLVGSVLVSIAAGFATARFLSRPSPRPVVALGIVLFVVGVGVQASVWEAMPLWYHLPFLALLVPATIVGGRLGRRHAAT